MARVWRLFLSSKPTHMTSRFRQLRAKTTFWASSSEQRWMLKTAFDDVEFLKASSVGSRPFLRGETRGLHCHVTF